MNKITLTLILGLGLTFFNVHHKEAVAYEEAKTIVETAIAAGSFETLVAAVQAADLVDVLGSEGPFTVFAPTDEAFAALPEGTVEALLNDIPKLSAILTYHVAAGKLMAADVVGSDYIETVFGQPAPVLVDDSVTIAGATITATDIVCSNGVIHVIDAVMIPKDLAEVAADAGSFSTLLAAAEAADLVEVLKSGGPFTVFAPTDEAFDALPDGNVASLLEPESKDTLAQILTYHVVPGKVLAADVIGAAEVTTVEGSTLSIHVVKSDEGEVTEVQVGGAKVLATDIIALNGVIHVIDSVLLPGE
jgi:transforming growth factor-beta-induced protein